MCVLFYQDIAPQYAAILMGISNTIGTIPGIISPAITGFIVRDRVSIIMTSIKE